MFFLPDIVTVHVTDEDVAVLVRLRKAKSFVTDWKVLFLATRAALWSCMEAHYLSPCARLWTHTRTSCTLPCVAISRTTMTRKWTGLAIVKWVGGWGSGLGGGGRCWTGRGAEYPLWKNNINVFPRLRGMVWLMPFNAESQTLCFRPLIDCQDFTLQEMFLRPYYNVCLGKEKQKWKHR